MKIDDSVQGVAFVALAVFLLNQLLTLSDGDPSQGSQIDIEVQLESRTRTPVVPEVGTVEASIQVSPVVHHDTVEAFREQIAAMLVAREFLKARSHLIEQAALASDAGQPETLAYVLALLGEVSTESHDFGAARIYLEESLDMFVALNDPIGQAYTYVQLGHMHIESRAVARHAANAYNLLLLARYQISHFRYDEAQSNLTQVIDQSLEIERYGTAASALESLARLKRMTGEVFDAEQALFESAELHALAGRESHAMKALDALLEQGVDPYTVHKHRHRVEEALETFRINTEQVFQAREYRSLYYQYRNAGDQQRAWQFRVKAEALLAQISSRAMYYRQPDVMAILYNSNYARWNATRFVNQASALYASQGEADLAERAGKLNALIY